jgi:hypothetical protein
MCLLAEQHTVALAKNNNVLCSTVRHGYGHSMSRTGSRQRAKPPPLSSSDVRVSFLR